MKSTTPIEVKAHLHTAAIVELSALGICVVVSLAVAVYEFVNFIRKYTKKNTVANEKNDTEIS